MVNEIRHVHPNLWENRAAFAANVVSLAAYRRERDEPNPPPRPKPAAARRPGTMLVTNLVGSVVAELSDHSRPIRPADDLTSEVLDLIERHCPSLPACDPDDVDKAIGALVMVFAGVLATVEQHHGIGAKEHVLALMHERVDRYSSRIVQKIQKG